LFRELSPRREAFRVRDTATTPCLLFPDLCDRPLTAVFDLPNASSDGGGVLLKVADRRLGLIERLAGALVDGRQPGKVRHAFADLLGQRVRASRSATKTPTTRRGSPTI
jgi:hypothetical protein